MEKEKRKIDVPVAGVVTRYMTMEELMHAFSSCKDTDPETAGRILEYACDCEHIPAKLAYSRFLRSTAKLRLTDAERYQKAERLLRGLLELWGVPDAFTAEVALELGLLYENDLHRYVGALAMFLYAKRLGGEVEERKLERLLTRVGNDPVAQYDGASRDVLWLGRELYYAGRSFHLAAQSLREAVDRSGVAMDAGEREARLLHAQACLSLAQLYESHRHESEIYRKESQKMYAEARKFGYPDFLSRP